MQFSPFALEIAGAIARYLLTLVGMWAMQHHIINATQATELTEHAGTHVAMGLLMAAPLLWSVWQKYKSRVKFLTALQTSPGPDAERTVAAKVSNGMGASVFVLLVFALPVGGVVFTSCAPKTWRLETRQAFDKDTLIKSLGALQHTAIQFGEATPPVIPLADAGLVTDGVQTILDAADAAGTGILGTTAAVLRSLTEGNPSAGIPPKLSAAALAKLAPFIQPVRDELAKWGTQ